MSYLGTFIILTPIQMPQMPALIPIQMPQMLQTNTITTVSPNNTVYSIKPASTSTSTTQTPITKFITEKKASIPQIPSQPLYAPLPVERPADKLDNLARAERREKLRAELAVNPKHRKPDKVLAEELGFNLSTVIRQRNALKVASHKKHKKYKQRKRLTESELIRLNKEFMKSGIEHKPDKVLAEEFEISISTVGRQKKKVRKVD